MVTLRKAIKHCQQENYKVEQKLKFEDMIEKGQLVAETKDIGEMELTELRRQLISTAMAYKGERMRN